MPNQCTSRTIHTSQSSLVHVRLRESDKGVREREGGSPSDYDKRKTSCVDARSRAPDAEIASIQARGSHSSSFSRLSSFDVRAHSSLGSLIYRDCSVFESVCASSQGGLVPMWSGDESRSAAPLRGVALST